MCLFPRSVWRYRGDTGRPHFDLPPLGVDSAEIEQFQVPCGRCVECLTSYSSEWAMRIMQEASLYEHNCFVTLTYARNPVDLVKRDLQLFLKRLRAFLAPRKIRFFACGEYGGQGNRPHYHVCIFGYDFPDKVYWSKSKSGFPVFVSEILRQCWDYHSAKLGWSYVEDLTYDSAFYCAKYLQKLDPRPHGVQPFTVMSNRPGIGYGAIDPRSARYDRLYLAGKQARLPRYWLTVLERDGVNISVLKDTRVTVAIMKKMSYAELQAHRKCVANKKGLPLKKILKKTFKTVDKNSRLCYSYSVLDEDEII